jgi:hypothetical protein|tara:strand:- start:74 stop:283 length:210 start_codon:yes stop_codon:yes gene_type:complete
LETNTNSNSCIDLIILGERSMDALKYKSVAVKLSIWKLLKKLGEDEFRSVGKVIEYLTMKECKKKNIDT